MENWTRALSSNLIGFEFGFDVQSFIRAIYRLEDKKIAMPACNAAISINHAHMLGMHCNRPDIQISACVLVGFYDRQIPLEKSRGSLISMKMLCVCDLLP